MKTTPISKREAWLKIQQADWRERCENYKDKQERSLADNPAGLIPDDAGKKDGMPGVHEREDKQ